MNARHTPGPWTAERDPCHFDTLSSIRAGDGALCVEVGGKADPPVQEANARLIAAAPDLIDALGTAAFRMQILVYRMPPDGNGKTSKALAQTYVDAARAAVAKATA